MNLNFALKIDTWTFISKFYVIRQLNVVNKDWIDIIRLAFGCDFIHNFSKLVCLGPRVVTPKKEVFGARALRARVWLAPIIYKQRFDHTRLLITNQLFH